MATAIEEGSVHFLSEKLLMEFLEQDVMSKIRHLFHMLDMNDDGTISMTELVVAINDPLFRRGLRSIFPTLDPVSLLGSATLMDGELGPEQFHDLCKKHADKGKLESCIYFPLVVSGEPSAVGAFPKALPNFQCIPTKYVQCAHLTVFKGHFDSWFQQPEASNATSPGSSARCPATTSRNQPQSVASCSLSQGYLADERILQVVEASQSCDILHAARAEKTHMVPFLSFELLVASFDTEVGDCGAEHSGGGTKTLEDPGSREVFCLEPLDESTSEGALSGIQCRSARVGPGGLE